MDIGLVRSNGPYLAASRSSLEELVRLVATADAVAAICHQSIELEAS